MLPSIYDLWILKKMIWEITTGWDCCYYATETQIVVVGEALEDAVASAEQGTKNLRSKCHPRFIGVYFPYQKWHELYYIYIY